MWAGKCHLSVKSVKLYSLLYKILIPVCTFATVLEVWRSSCSSTTFQWSVSKEGFLHSLIGCIVLASHLICYELEQRELGPDCRVDRGEVPTYFSILSTHTHTSSLGRCVFVLYDKTSGTSEGKEQYWWLHLGAETRQSPSVQHPEKPHFPWSYGMRPLFSASFSWGGDVWCFAIEYDGVWS